MFGRKKKDGAGPAPDWNAELRAALEDLRLPGGDRDLVSLGMVKAMHADASGVRVVLNVQTPSRPYRERLEAMVREKIDTLGWGLPVAVELSAPAEPAAAAPAKKGASGVARIVAVASGKGGVGKSTVALNLACALQAAGHRVGLLDADIYGPSIPHMLGMRDVRPPTGGPEKLAPVVRDGLKLMSMGFLVETDRAVIWRGPMVHGAIKQFFDDVAWGELDYLVIDLPPGTGDAQLTLVQQATVAGAVIVTTPQDVAMIDARKAFNMFRDTNVPVIGIVENMSLFTCPDCGSTSEIFGHGGARTWADEAGCAFLGAIPISLAVRRHGDDGTVAVRAEDTPAEVKAAFATIAQRVHEDVSSRPTPRKLGL